MSYNALDAPGAMNIGSTYATSVNIGHAGITTTVIGDLTQITGAFSLTGNAPSQLSTTVGSLTLDAAAGLSLGATNATSVDIGHAGIITTITGGLTQLTGAVSLTGNAASQFSTTAGGLTLDAAAALSLGGTNATSVDIGHGGITTTVTGGFTQSGGAFSLTGNAPSVLTTTAGAITINPTGALVLGSAPTTAVSIGGAAIPTNVLGDEHISGILFYPNFSFATTAALAAFGGGPAALAAAGLPDGTLAFVVSQRALYSFNAVTPAWDFTASDTSYWLSKNAYFASDAGTVDADGLTSLTPTTSDELVRRWGPDPKFTAAGTVSINLLGATFASNFNPNGTLNWLPTNQVVVQGEVQNIGASGAFTAVTARSQATGQTLRVTIAGKTYTPGQFIQIIAGTAANIGAMMMVIADLGGGTAEVSPAVKYIITTNTNFVSEVVPVVGDTAQIIDFTNVTGAFTCRTAGPNGITAGLCRAIVRNLRLTGTGTTKLINMANNSDGQMYWVECINASAQTSLVGRIPRFNISLLSSATPIGPFEDYSVSAGGSLNTASYQLDGNATVSTGHLVLGSLFTIKAQSLIINAMQMASTATAGRIILVVRSGATVRLFLAAAISFNVTAGGIIIADVQSGSLINETLGTWATAIITNATEAALPFKICSQTGVNTFTVATGVWSAGPVAMTIASLDGAFAGKACDPRSGVGIFRNDVA